MAESLLTTKEAVKFMLCCRNGEMDVVERLIFKENIEYDEHIKKIISNHDTEDFNSAKQMFERRELNKKLQQELVGKDVNDKKTKI